MITVEQAQKAGLRASASAASDLRAVRAHARAATVTALCRLIENSPEEPSLDALGRHAGMSPWHLQRTFKAVTGLTPKQYATAHRASRVQATLRSSGSVVDAIYDAGFNSNGRFYERSNAVLGMTPTRYREGGKGVTIRFAIGECSLGAILVARSEIGVCAILLGDDADALARDLQDRFPKSDLVGGDAGFEQWVAQVVGLVEAPRLGLDLPLDLRGTVFQRRVWQALMEIAPGSTQSYAEIARRIGKPSAARAVALACAANPLAIAIPCHRVVRSDGGLSGYRWGVARKRALLEREGAAGSKAPPERVSP